MNKPVLYWMIFLALSLAGCEKVIDLKLNSGISQLVIEGNVTNLGGKQVVTISRSVAYGDKTTSVSVLGASVTVTDNRGGSWNFSETQPGIYTNSTLRGLVDRTYTLKVNVASVIYTAESTMPQPTSLDSISIKTYDFGGDNNLQVQVHYNDVANVANQYRYIVSVDGKPEKAIFVENDRFTDGRPVTSPLFYPNAEDDDTFKIKPGKVVTVEMQCIDKPIFTYWFTLMQQSMNGPGGGTVPGNPPSNLSNGALGYFSAHTVTTKTVAVK